MFATVVDVVVRPGKQQAFIKAMDPMRSRLGLIPGYSHHVMLSVKGESRLVVFLIVWRNESAAQEFERELYPNLLPLAAPIADAVSPVRHFSICSHSQPIVPQQFQTISSGTLLNA